MPILQINKWRLRKTKSPQLVRREPPDLAQLCDGHCRHSLWWEAV